MASDAEARKAVLELMRRFDSINEQHLSMAYVLAKRDSGNYARLLESAERAATLVIRPLKDADSQHNQVYSALDDPEAGWPTVVFAMLNRSQIVLTGDEATEHIKLVRRLEERFDAEERKKKRED
jgi:hypothetical protein